MINDDDRPSLEKIYKNNFEIMKIQILKKKDNIFNNPTLFQKILSLASLKKKTEYIIATNPTKTKNIN